MSRKHTKEWLYACSNNWVSGSGKRIAPISTQFEIKTSAFPSIYPLLTL